MLTLHYWYDSAVDTLYLFPAHLLLSLDLGSRSVVLQGVTVSESIPLPYRLWHRQSGSLPVAAPRAGGVAHHLPLLFLPMLYLLNFFILVVVRRGWCGRWPVMKFFVWLPGSFFSWPWRCALYCCWPVPCVACSWGA